MTSTLVILYLLPTIIAIIMGCKRVGVVFVVNLFTGWTFIGWVVALVVAVWP